VSAHDNFIHMNIFLRFKHFSKMVSSSIRIRNGHSLGKGQSVVSLWQQGWKGQKYPQEACDFEIPSVVLNPGELACYIME
jgi:hypothetical protein